MKRLLTLPLVSLLTTTALAQLPLRASIDSPNNDPAYGVATAGVGDMNGDGLADYAVTEASTAAFQPAGIVYVHSGADEALLHTFTGVFSADGYGLSLAGIGDVNGDGRGDLLIGAASDDTNGTGSGRAEVRSGLDGSVLYEYFGPTSFDLLGDHVASAGDVNRDGVPDFLITEPGRSRFYLYSGVDGSLIRLFPRPATETYISFPDSVAGAGDVDGDGIGDVVIGEQSARGINLTSNAGALEIYSTATGARLLKITGDDYQEQLGFRVAGGVDVDGDGVPDVIGGAKGDVEPGNPASGSITLFSGADGNVLAKDFGAQAGPVRMGHVVCFVGDANGDGTEDYAGVAMTSGTVGKSGYVRIYSGVDHSLLEELGTTSSTDFFGSGFDVAGDTNGDALPEFVIGAKGARRADVMTLAGSRRFGEGADPQQVLSLDWIPTTGPKGKVRAQGAQPGALGALGASLVPASVTAGGTTVLINLGHPSAFTRSRIFDGSGAFELGATLLTPSYAGLTWFCQAVEFAGTKPLRLHSSNGLELRFTD